MQRTFPGNWLRAPAFFFFFLFDDRAIKINFCLLFGEALGLALQLTKRRSEFVSRRKIFKVPGDGEELWNKLLNRFVYFLSMLRAPTRLFRLTNTFQGVFVTTPLHARQVVGACFAFEELSETRHDHSIELFQRFAKLFWARPTNEEKPPDRFVIRKLRADWGETWSLQFISYGNSIAKFFILLLWCSLSVVVQKNRAVLCLKKFKHSHTDFRKPRIFTHGTCTKVFVLATPNNIFECNFIRHCYQSRHNWPMSQSATKALNFLIVSCFQRIFFSVML